MRQYETVPVPATVREKLVKTTCDLCGAEAKGGNWESSCYQVSEAEVEVTVRHKDGSNYPEGGGGTSFVVDMCPTCFESKLIPWLESQGCKTERKDWER